MELKHTDKSVSKGMEDESWIEKFKAMCLLNRCSSPSSLISLMTYYARNIRPNVNETRPLKADKLRDFISETLLFFLYCFRAQKEGLRESERAAYLDIMSDLLAVYIDTELRTSRRSTEVQANISARLTSYLYVCLDHSPQHLIDTLLKVQFMSSTYHQILDPLIEKILQIVPRHPTDDITYVRYFLIYRIWRRLSKDASAKNEIVTKARESMGPKPTTLSKYLVDNVLPKVPNNENNVSIELLLSQHIDLERSCANFIKFSKEATTKASDAKASESEKPEDNTTDNSNNSSQSNNIQISSNLPLNTDKLTTKSKILSRKSLKKHNEVVVIDLTSDETAGKVLRQKKKTRLSWLQEVAKRKTSIANSTSEDSQKLDLALFLTTDVSQSITIEDVPQETETSALGIDTLSLTEEHDGIECQPALLTKEPDTRDNEIHLLPELVDSRAEVINKISLTNENTDDNEIKVQIDDVQNELEITTTEINNEINIEINNEINNEMNNELVCHDIVNESVKNEIIDDTNSPSTNLATEYQRQTVLHINQRFKDENKVETIETTTSTTKIRNTEFQEQHIDGLTLLASVSQRVSHLSTTTTTNREIIKVKDYKSLTTLGSKDGEDNEIHTNSGEMSSSMVAIYPDDDIDKVAFHVEVSSSEDVSDHCTSTVYHPQIVDKLPNEETNEYPSTSADSSIQSEREVIMNGETIVLYQKSPNSNMYIINKAGEEVNNLPEKAIQSGHEDPNYSYEIYDKMYRIPQPPTSQAFEDPRRAQKVKVTNQNDSTRASIDHQKSGKKKQPTTGIEVKSPRRHRMRQEFNGCTPDLVDPHSIHIQPTTSLYHANYPGPELYISCHPNCNPVTCGIPVNHPTPPSIHPNSPRCAYLNCGYDIVTHCTQYMSSQCMPPSENKQGPSVDNSYYIEPDVKMETKSVYKIEVDSDIDNKKRFSEANVKSKLPPKKRFSMMSTNYEEATVKTESSTINYPNTPMISIASLESNSVKVSKPLDKHHTNELIRHDYRKEPITGYHYKDDRKRKRTNSKQRNNNKTNSECSDELLSRPSKKVQEQPKSPSKNSKRQTRLSQRKVPRVNYSYPEIDTECNPSGQQQQKRKRKKTSR